MGTCQCQDRLQNFEIGAQPIVPTKFLHPKKNINANQNTISPPKEITIPSHNPLSSFATPVSHFPQLDPKIKSVDQSLGEFKVGASINMWTEEYRPLYIDQAYKLQNGIIYKGQWYKGNINGNGIYYFPEGQFLRGFSMNNEVIGHARLIKQNGNYYQGLVAHNKANGEGILFQNGVFYQGVFVDNFLEGLGSQHSANYKFQGKYHHGARIHGKLTWDLDKNPSTVYQGGFFDQQFNGQGKLTNNIGEYKGMFQNGKKKGRGVFTWKNGERFQGYYDSDLKNGEGRMYNAKGEVVLQGNWSNDRFKN